MRSNENKEVGRIMDAKEVCKIYKVHPATLCRWVRSGLKRHELWMGLKRVWRYHEFEINEFIESGKTRHRVAVAEAGRKASRRIHDKYFVNHPLPPKEGKK